MRRGWVAVTTGDHQLLTSEGGNIVGQDRGLCGGRKRHEMSIKRLRLCVGFLVFGAVATVLGNNIASADEEVWKGPVRLTYTVTEEGETYAFWGSEQEDTPEDVTGGEGVLPVPADLADEVAKILANPEGNAGRLEYIIVLKGSLRAVQICHIHDGREECHP